MNRSITSPVLSLGMGLISVTRTILEYALYVRILLEWTEMRIFVLVHLQNSCQQVASIVKRAEIEDLLKHLHVEDDVLLTSGQIDQWSQVQDIDAKIAQRSDTVMFEELFLDAVA